MPAALEGCRGFRKRTFNASDDTLGKNASPDVASRSRKAAGQYNHRSHRRAGQTTGPGAQITCRFHWIRVGHSRSLVRLARFPVPDRSTAKTPSQSARTQTSHERSSQNRVENPTRFPNPALCDTLHESLQGCRTPKSSENFARERDREASWSAAVLCRFPSEICTRVAVSYRHETRRQY